MANQPERTGAQGIALIKQFEGLRLARYLDAVGKPTIGYGHLILPNERFTRPLTPAEAEALLRRDLRGAELNLRKLLHVPVTQQQFDALMSFVFNLGAGRLRSSTLLRYLNAGARTRAADQFLVWNKAGGKPLAGLTKRRQAERALFLS
ncbi:MULTISPECIES: lysozyme [Burkholderia]|jgi:lysozyme|uniref:Lysozyme n=1 Tax=Burkholderia ambifaria (strain ATCC BAA-244 / DSM 16087 / CCUG 44356 / LMG 19182 / AMMD) TaxID=339670 RepID=Q0B7R2_BURCM|nr:MULTISPECIES: lysozyme [Burkholderia]ABI89811.1 Lysozyme [Burkholderia ambifaria AMMD]AJY24186.1 phage lysozyme family protein [Burkholderia ambifaria AMMD]MBR7930352.1 lysozyme [Burkholderia ambifaria]MBR8333432.1 lysozyme [Burkholderia ambifaria]PEH67913.1 muraminidase [Burkholderia ambifaria]